MHHLLYHVSPTVPSTTYCTT